MVLPYNILESPAWRDLHPLAVCIFIELKKRFFGLNNGEISLSCREVAERLRCSKNTASQMFYELQAHGFIKIRVKGRFTYHNATTWILTTEVYNGHSPTNEWKNWSPENPIEVPP